MWGVVVRVCVYKCVDMGICGWVSRDVGRGVYGYIYADVWICGWKIEIWKYECALGMQMCRCECEYVCVNV